jgi:hypothetical protein
MSSAAASSPRFGKSTVAFRRPDSLPPPSVTTRRSTSLEDDERIFTRAKEFIRQMDEGIEWFREQRKKMDHSEF